MKVENTTIVKRERSTSQSKRPRETTEDTLNHPKKRLNSDAEEARGLVLSTACISSAPDSENPVYEPQSLDNSAILLPPADYTTAFLNLSSSSLELTAVNLLQYHEHSTPDIPHDGKF